LVSTPTTRGRSDGSEELEEVRLATAPGHRSVHQVQHHVHLFERRSNLSHHTGVHLVQRFVDPRQIEEDRLAALFSEDADDSVAGGLGLVGHDRNLVADEGVEERALAGVRPPYQSYGSGGKLNCS
jgi:hypothetical protein